MEYLPVLFVTLQCLLTVNGCERVNFTISPTSVYVGDELAFTCCTSDITSVTVCDLGSNVVSCDLLQQPTKLGIFDELNTSCSKKKVRDDDSCPFENGTRVHAFAYATPDMRKKNYTCTVGSRCSPGTCNRTVSILDVPELSLTPQDMTFNDNQNVTIRCTNITELVADIVLNLTLWNKTMLLKTNSSVNSVEMAFNISHYFHEAEVHCEAPQMSRIKAKNMALRVNYILSKRSIVNYHSVNGIHTFDCAEQIESRPGVQYKWFLVNSTQEIETQSSYICKAPQLCNISVTCVAKNNVTLSQSNVTFIYQSRPIELNVVKEQEHYHMIIAVSVASAVGTLVIVTIVIVLVCKWRICRRESIQHSKMLCCRNEDEVISMNDNELYEAVMPMMPPAVLSGDADVSTQRERMDSNHFGYCESKGAATSSIHLKQHGVQSQHAVESLLVASVTVTGNLKYKVGSKAHLMLLFEQSSTLKDIQENIEEVVSSRNSLKHVAFLLRQSKKGLALSLTDNVNIDVSSVASNQRLRDFLKQLVECYMDTSSDNLRLDLLNYPGTDTSKGKKLAKTLTCLLGIPVYLSHDMYGVNTAIDDERCVADIYFHRRHIEDTVVYADVDLSKDSRRFPVESQEKVVYSEVVRPALRPPRFAGQ